MTGVRAITLLFAAVQIHVKELTHNSIVFWTPNDTYIPNGIVKTKVYLSQYLPPYTHTTMLSEYMKVPLLSGYHQLSSDWKTLDYHVDMKVFNTSGDMLLWVYMN
jgi:hypothetical protein